MDCGKTSHIVESLGKMVSCGTIKFTNTKNLYLQGGAGEGGLRTLGDARACVSSCTMHLCVLIQLVLNMSCTVQFEKIQGWCHMYIVYIV